MTVSTSLMNGSWSRPARSGSTPSSTSGGAGPESEIRRRPLAPELEHPVAVPAGHEVERLLPCVLDPRALHVRVEVRHVDEAGAVPVRGCCHLSCHLLLAEGGADGDELILLDVRAEDDGELCELGGACG